MTKIEGISEKNSEKIQELSAEISNIKETSVKNGELLVKLENSNKNSSSKKRVLLSMSHRLCAYRKIGHEIFKFKTHLKKMPGEISNGDLYLSLKDAISDKLQQEHESLYNKLSDVVGSTGSADTKPLVDVKLGCLHGKQKQ